MDEKDPKKNAEMLLSMGGSYSEVAEFLSDQLGVQDPAKIIKETVQQWVEEDVVMGRSRRAVQRRRLQRQIRQAMDSQKVGDAVRAETILARLDNEESEAIANRTVEDFEEELNTRTEEEMRFFVDNGNWPDKNTEEEDVENSAIEDETNEAHNNKEIH